MRLKQPELLHHPPVSPDYFRKTLAAQEIILQRIAIVLRGLSTFENQLGVPLKTLLSMPSVNSMNQALREHALRSFETSLTKAESDAYTARGEVEKIKLQLQGALERLKGFEDATLAFKALIADYSLDANSEPPTAAPAKTAGADSENEQDHEPAKGEGSSQRRRLRLNAPLKLLELITEDGFFKTTEQLVALLQKYYGTAIREKTSKNAVWGLNAEGSIRKYYFKEDASYIYGLPEWFLNDKPNPAHLRQAQSPLEALQAQTLRVIEPKQKALQQDETPNEDKEEANGTE